MKKTTKKKTGAVRLKKPRKLSLAKDGRALKIDFSTRGERSRTAKPFLFAVPTIDLRRPGDPIRPAPQLTLWERGVEVQEFFSRNVLNLRKFFPRGRNFTRAVSATLIATVIFMGLNGVGSTVSFYNDIESSTENTFEAGSVDFSLGVSGWQATTTAVSMPPGDITMKEVTVFPGDSNPFQYYATSTNITGDSDFCNGLLATARIEGVEMYNGPLVTLLTATTTTLDSWEFTYTTGTADFQNRVCDFDIDYNSWQTRHNYPSFENGGFNDTEKVENHLASWGFRINKVYYDVALDRGTEGDNEWVEIYNQTNTALDISGWQICDNFSCDTLPATPLIPALKYAVIVATSTTATSTTVSGLLPAFWYLPSEVTKINIDSPIGNGLANGGDRLILKRPDGVVIDAMNWQDDTGVWNPGAVDVVEGNVLARVPSGYDTDHASDWIELEPPAVDLIYPDEGGSYTWYWTYNYTITWTATNNNGPDGDLDISIFYVKDVNHDTMISFGDTTHTIAETTANDGSYTWKVPSGFLGYIWIYLVATGPENPMLNTGTVSGKIYDPMPLFLAPEGMDPNDVDMDPPVITLIGDNPALLPKGSIYGDLGATVSDNVNNNLGYRTEGEEGVDTGILGEYTITFTAVDQAGNVGTATRLVIVYDPALGVPEIGGAVITNEESGEASEQEPAPAEEVNIDESTVGAPTQQDAGVGEVEPQQENAGLTDGSGAVITNEESGEASEQEPAPAEEVNIDESNENSEEGESVETAPTFAVGAPTQQDAGVGEESNEAPADTSEPEENITEPPLESSDEDPVGEQAPNGAGLTGQAETAPAEGPTEEPAGEPPLESSDEDPVGEQAPNGAGLTGQATI